ELVYRPDAAETGDEQDYLHRVPVLTQERVPARLRLRLGELVRTVLPDPFCRLRRRQALAWVDAECPGDLWTREHVPWLPVDGRTSVRPERLRRHGRLLRPRHTQAGVSKDVAVRPSGRSASPASSASYE